MIRQLFACLFVLATVRAWASGYQLQPLKEPAPGLTDSVREGFASDGLRVLDKKGKPFVDVWLRKSLPTKEDPGRLGVDFGRLKEGCLLAVMRFHARGADFRGNRFAAGVYTCRYVVQPEDGDHLGVSETRDFYLLCPAKDDAKPDSLPAEEIVTLSLKVSGRKHPSTMYLVKLFDEAKSSPRIVEDEEHGYVILDCEVPAAEDGKEAVRLGFVLVGESEEA